MQKQFQNFWHEPSYENRTFIPNIITSLRTVHSDNVIVMSLEMTSLRTASAKDTTIRAYSV